MSNGILEGKRSDACVLRKEANKYSISWPNSNISEPLIANDIMCTRGAGTKFHIGNIRYRQMVDERKSDYQKACPKKKASIAQAIVSTWRNQSPPGRFLAKKQNSSKWYDIGNAQAIKKVKQALRECRGKTKKEMFCGGSKKRGATDPDCGLESYRKGASTNYIELNAIEAEGRSRTIRKKEQAPEEFLGMTRKEMLLDDSKRRRIDSDCGFQVYPKPASTEDTDLNSIEPETVESIVYGLTHLKNNSKHFPRSPGLLAALRQVQTELCLEIDKASLEFEYGSDVAKDVFSTEKFMIWQQSHLLPRDALGPVETPISNEMVGCCLKENRFHSGKCNVPFDSSPLPMEEFVHEPILSSDNIDPLIATDHPNDEESEFQMNCRVQLKECEPQHSFPQPEMRSKNVDAEATTNELVQSISDGCALIHNPPALNGSDTQGEKPSRLHPSKTDESDSTNKGSGRNGPLSPRVTDDSICSQGGTTTNKLEDGSGDNNTDP